MNEDSGLDELLQRYRAACPDPEPGADFMPRLWEKIESRHSFWFVFEGLGQTAMTASAALCVLFVILNLVSSAENRVLAPTYVDALMAEHTVEKTYYTEAIRSTPTSEEAPEAIEH